jgi:enamine deaminase RidA (YjgF/YER057c/UK114 family)
MSVEPIGSIEPIEPSGWPRAKGYSDGMLAPSGSRILFVAGQIGWDGERKLVAGGFAEQFAQALKNVVAVVGAAGGKPADIARVTLYVTDKRQYVAAREAIGVSWREIVGRHFPAMAMVEVSGLLEPGALVEIEATAAIG